MSAPVGYQAEANALKARFAGQWARRTPVSWPNTPDNKPDGRTCWVRFGIVNGPAEAASIGTTVRHRHDGEVIVEVHGPLGQEEAPVLALADAAAGIYRNWESGDLRFWTPRVVRVGERNGWYVVNVIAPFERDESFQ